MLSAEQAKEITDKAVESGLAEKNVKVRKVLGEIEEKISLDAKEGFYCVYYDLSFMGSYVKTKIKDALIAANYKVIESGSEYLTIRWDA